MDRGKIRKPVRSDRQIDAERRRRRKTVRRLKSQHGQTSRRSTATLSPSVNVEDSAITLRRDLDNEGTEYSFDGRSSDEMDTRGGLEDTSDADIESEQPLIVATDFGTTFSSIAYARRSDDSHPTVGIVQGYPDDPLRNRDPSLQVPTESWYPTSPQEDLVLRKPKRGSLRAKDTEPEPEPELENLDDFDSDDNARLAEPNPRRRSQLPNHRVPDFVWGYGTEAKIERDMDPAEYTRISRSKLWLDESPHTQAVRDEVCSVIARLKERRIIKDDVEIVTNYLTRLYEHAKDQLVQRGKLSERTRIEHVLTVPAIWGTQQLKIMQSAMETAVRNAEFGNANDLFLVAEPEASAAYVLRESGAIHAGEAFLVVDAGGGTVDVTTYSVKSQDPLRLSEELVSPSGSLTGSSFLNETFRAHLRERLRGEEGDITNNGSTVEGIIEHAAKDFESKKRIVNIQGTMERWTLFVSGLRMSTHPRKRFDKNKVIFDQIDFENIFLPCLNNIAELVKEQLVAAKAKGTEVNKVVLVGGFAGSISLRNHLAIKLKEWRNELQFRPRLIKAINVQHPETAVAHGAILRAWDKEEGPARIIQSSYGFEVTEEYNPADITEHKGGKYFYEKLDGRKYMRNVINWLVIKGRVTPEQEYPTHVYIIFPVTRKTFECEEVLWVTEGEPESHYQKSHPKNREAIEAGKVTTNFTSLIKKGLIKPTTPAPGDAGVPHYHIEYDLVIIVNGRNLRYEARWPPGGKVMAEGQICIAASFRPGVN